MTISNNYNWSNEHFLIADDDYYSYLLVEKVLKGTGAKIDYAPNGAAALNEIVPNSSFTVVILDILMPKLSGFEVIEAAKLIRPDIIYIAYTADIISLNKINCQKLGFHACIPKPALPSRLLNTIDEVLVLRGQLT